MQLLILDFLSISESLQTGDIAYYASNSNIQGGFKVISDLTAFGTVVDINRQNGKITVLWDDSDNDSDGSPDIAAPQQGDYIMFGKSEVVNSSSLSSNSSLICSKTVLRKLDVPKLLSKLQNFSLSWFVAFLPIGHQLIVEPLYEIK